MNIQLTNELSLLKSLRKIAYANQDEVSEYWRQFAKNSIFEFEENVQHLAKSQIDFDAFDERTREIVRNASDTESGFRKALGLYVALIRKEAHDLIKLK